MYEAEKDHRPDHNRTSGARDRKCGFLQIFVSSLKASGAYIFPFLMGLICNWGLGLTAGYTAGVVFGLGVAGIFMGTATE
ncbi:MAG: hypothetical protein IJS12_03010 [Lachnospiraceae bacterium]|nr:hypothetical protein [Lachnospiraceae bacterium]